MGQLYLGTRAITSIIETGSPILEGLTVTPSTTTQTITPTSGIDGFSNVAVNAVTSSIDSNIQAGNIKKDVTILGVTGSFEGGGGTPTLESLTVTPSTTTQTITPTSGVDGFDSVHVSAVTASIDNNITAGNIKSGVDILGVQGTVVELAGETRTVSITSTSGNTFTPSSGKNGITSIKVTPTNQDRTVIPSTTSQSLTVASGYSGNGTITVNAVTSGIDSNITAGNIKKDVTILGVTGTFEGGAAPTLQSKTLNVGSTTATTTTITPGASYDGLSSVVVDLSAIEALLTEINGE